MTLAPPFLARIRDRDRARSSDPDALEAMLAHLAAHGRDAWPHVTIDDEAFASFLAERVPDEGSLADALGAMAGADLYLACGCARSDPVALEAFEKRYFGQVDAVVGRMRGAGVGADDVKQMLREKLFVGSAGSPPRILEYAGKGALASWFRVATTRLVLNLLRGPKEIAVDDVHLLEAPGVPLDQELEYLKLRYSAEFKAAFSATIGGLEARERALLRYALAEGLSSDEIASIYGVHRTTVNRWLADLRRALGSGVRKAMAERLRVSKKELESIMRLIESRIEITLGGAGTGGAPGAGS